MLKRTDRGYHSAACGESLRHSDQSSEQFGLARNSGNVVPFPHQPDMLARGRSAHSVDELALLEAENAELRNSAIELALEIQDLREKPVARRRSRPF
jgi:hypothetical protein